MVTKPVVFTRPALAAMLEPSTFNSSTTRPETRGRMAMSGMVLMSLASRVCVATEIV
jgi:hypothetical protein